MACGCKKKKLNQPARTAKVEVVEGEMKEVRQRPPSVVSPPPRPNDNVENVVNKLNDILKT